MKIYDRKPIYSDMVDKYKAKLFVSKIIGEEYVVPTFGAWNSFEEIDFNSLPNRFVLKTNHDSGGMVICRNKKNFDYNNAKKILNAHLKRNGFWYGREWPYKNVKPLIIAEQLLENGGQFEKGTCLNVYKFFTFNGEPLIIQTIQNDKQPNETIDYFDCNWNLLRLILGRAGSGKTDIMMNELTAFEITVASATPTTLSFKPMTKIRLSITLITPPNPNDHNGLLLSPLLRKTAEPKL